MTRACRICGCTESHACVNEHGPCWWVEADLCSHCAVPDDQEVVMSVKGPFFKAVLRGDYADCDTAAMAGVEFGQVIQPGELQRHGIRSLEQIITFVAIAAVTALQVALTEGDLCGPGDGDAANKLFSQAVAALPGQLRHAATDIADDEVCDRVNAYRHSAEAALQFCRKRSFDA